MYNYLSKNKMKFISGIVVVVKLTRCTADSTYTI
jgi:hypothetical protein